MEETTNQSSICKRQKEFNAGNIVISSRDRISRLPDSVLCHILSFLPTNLSVATSILAKRWKFLWMDVTSLDLEFEPHDAGSMRFRDMINKVMKLHNVSRLNKFRISYRDENVFRQYKLDFSEDELDTLVESVVGRNVQVLILKFCYPITSPHCIFTCGTLVDLRLYDCVGIPSTVCLPNLKKLHLFPAQFEADASVSRLISGCPMLEELRAFISTCCNVSSATIKSLDLGFPSVGGFDASIEINTPAIRFLRLSGAVSGLISAGTMKSLVETDIQMYNAEVKDDDVYSASWLEFVEKLCQVKCLRFSSDYSKFFDSAFAAATLRFSNLTKLECSADWRLLVKFLESSDNLEILIIGNMDRAELKRWKKPQNVPKCLSSHLSQVKFDRFGYLEDEFEMVRYILKNAKVLNVMDIVGTSYFDSKFDPKFEALQTISLMERASDKCKVDFS